MKGIILTEFLEMVEERWGYETVDNLITHSQLKNNGAYTSVGTYDHRELISLIKCLSLTKNKPVNFLLIEFGYYLFPRFMSLYPSICNKFTDVIDFISKIQSVIHQEVKKLYPEAQLPEFTVPFKTDNQLIIHYQSIRKFKYLAYGLIKACTHHYGEDFKIFMKDCCKSNQTIFKIIRND